MFLAFWSIHSLTKLFYLKKIDFALHLSLMTAVHSTSNIISAKASQPAQSYPKTCYPITIL
jgi:hypothetical protein